MLRASPIYADELAGDSPHDLRWQPPPPAKQQPSTKRARFKYYAGYSEEFAAAAIEKIAEPGDVILDPWNGSGTTTAAAARSGYRSIGLDLNPVMAVTALGRLASKSDEPKVQRMLKTAMTAKAKQVCEDDPLLQWLDYATAAKVRTIASHLGRDPHLPGKDAVARAAALSLIFNAVRKMLHPFIGTNPTWVRLRKSNETALTYSRSWIQDHIETSLTNFHADDSPSTRRPLLLTADSRCSLPRATAKATVVVSSPPYCTRIDYAVATRPELAVLNLPMTSQRQLRDSLLGTTTIASNRPQEPITPSAQALLRLIRRHPSKASATYYHSTLAQYLVGLEASLQTMTQLPNLRSIGLVVQDSYYKDIRIDLAQIVRDMIGSDGRWCLEESVDFSKLVTKASMHPHGRMYRTSSIATESVLLFRKQSSEYRV